MYPTSNIIRLIKSSRIRIDFNRIPTGKRPIERPRPRMLKKQVATGGTGLFWLLIGIAVESL